jgi:glycogen operon protein
VGNFPVRWAEWNGEYRDAIRKYWRGEDGTIGELASRLAGSADIYQGTGRAVYASVNFVTAHDGYTLYDLVSYEQKHNEANGENNQDGHNDNLSRNWGAEGETSDELIIDLRFRLIRDYLATLAFSQGVPMLSHGDEIARTQHGNNNAYAQDNETSWVNWNLDDRRKALLEFTKAVFAIRHAHPIFRRRHFFHGAPVKEGAPKDLMWIRPDGHEMTEQDWQNARTRVLGALVNGDATDDTDERGRPISDDTMLLLTNAGHDEVRFTLPHIGHDGAWAELVDTAGEQLRLIEARWVGLAPHSLMLLRYGADRRLVVEAPSREEIVAAVPHALVHEP